MPTVKCFLALTTRCRYHMFILKSPGPFCLCVRDLTPPVSTVKCFPVLQQIEVNIACSDHISHARLLDLCEELWYS